MLVYYQFNTRGALYHHLLSLAHNYMCVLPLITHAAALNPVQDLPQGWTRIRISLHACVLIHCEVSLAASPCCMPWWSF